MSSLKLHLFYLVSMHLLIIFSFSVKPISGQDSLMDLNGGLMESSEDYLSTADTQISKSKSDTNGKKSALNQPDLTKKLGLNFSPVRIQRDNSMSGQFPQLYLYTKSSPTSLFDSFVANSSIATNSSLNSSFYNDNNLSSNASQSNLITSKTETNSTDVPVFTRASPKLSYRSRSWNSSNHASEEQSSDRNNQHLNQLKSPLRSHINQFGLDFLRQVHCGSSLGCNALHSPLSISIAVTMLLHGAGPDTKDEIMRFFRYSRTFNSSSILHHAYQDLLYELGKNQRQYILRIGSLALFSDKVNVSRRFRANVREDYHGTVFNLNFRKSRQTLEVLNNWLRSITINRSQNLFRERVRPDTQLLLLNAIYFQGRWKTSFQSLKQQRTFHNQVFLQPIDSQRNQSDSIKSNQTFTQKQSQCDLVEPAKYQQSQVNMMATTGSFPFAILNDGNIQIARLPYLGDLGMYILVPRNHMTLAKLLNNLTSEQLDQWIDELTLTELELLMPKFKMEQNYELRTLLSKLGLPDLFGGRADLSRLYSMNEALHAPQPQINSAIHRAMLEVNEEGTVASASTSFHSFTVSGFQGERMHVNRPFMFIVRDDVRAVNLFIGTLCTFL